VEGVLAADVKRLDIPDVWLFTPPCAEDERGWFSEAFNASRLAPFLGDVTFVQDNQSYSRAAHTLRGMHFQTLPKAQDKLVRVLRGAILDVAVDIRRGSPTFGRWVSARLSAANRTQIFVPKGFAHGFLTLEPDTEVLYKVSDHYSREHEHGIAWDDPALSIEWGAPSGSATIAERDRLFPRLADLPAFF
jgi:dTDP-4-dehydrorhamnose 3,5-epimerase